MDDKNYTVIWSNGEKWSFAKKEELADLVEKILTENPEENVEINLYFS